MLIEQDETFFLIPTQKFIAKSHMNPEETELLDFKEFRWWKLQDLARSSEQFAPRNLPSELGKIALHGPPSLPFNIGV